MTHDIAKYSFLDGFSNKIIRVTPKLIMIDIEPKTPMTAVGNHAKAKKSNMDAAADSTRAITNSGLIHTGVSNFLVSHSVYF